MFGDGNRKAFDLWRRRRRDFKATFGTPHGERVLTEIYKATGVGAECHVEGDPHQTAYNLGMRRVGLMIARALNETEREYLARAQRTVDDATDEDDITDD